MKKKFLLAILTMILCISAIGTLTACGEKHTHSYVESITAPTCTEQGFSTYTCSCGDSYVENYVNALGHTETVDSAVAPTCTETGLTEGKHCSVCDEVIVAQQTVSSTGHSFTQENTSNQYLKSSATCEDKAVYWKSCSCGEKGTDTFEYGQALGHTYDQENTASKYLKTEATCTNVAVYWKSCSCGEKGSETFNYGTTLPHDFGTYSKTQNATCTENAKETAYCQNKGCNEPDVRDIEGTVLGHGDINTNNVCSVCNKEVAYTKGMVYVAVTGGYQLIDMGSATDADIIIPKYYNGSPVISIADEVFKNKTTLTSITLPDSIVEIGEYAFYNCAKAKTINIPNGVTTIGEYAFFGCSSLTKIVVPKTVEILNGYTFGLCTSLEEITVPFIGRDRTSSSNEYLPWATFAHIFGMGTSSSRPEGATLMYVEVKLGSPIRTYNYYSYIPTSLRKVTVTDATIVGDDAFHGCDFLTSITLCDTITSIGNDAFNDCTNLESLIIPKNVTKIGSYAFMSCIKLKSIVIPEKVTSIGAGAFSYDRYSYSEMAITSIRFENTTGWKVGGNAIDVSDASTNAILFKKTYVNSSWSRS